MTQFPPGEYETRGGHRAVVEFIMPKPHESFPLIGRMFCDGKWSVKSWTVSGSWGGTGRGYDLLPPATVTYRRLPCGKHHHLPCEES